MAYVLKCATIRANNTGEGSQRIAELWQDIMSGKLPLMFDSSHGYVTGVMPVSIYENYENGDSGDYDLSIIAAGESLFAELDEQAAKERYRLYEEAGSSSAECGKKAWGKVWNETKAGTLARAFTRDYEYAIPPEHSGDGLWHCRVYIAL